MRRFPGILSGGPLNLKVRIYNYGIPVSDLGRTVRGLRIMLGHTALMTPIEVLLVLGAVWPPMHRWIAPACTSQTVVPESRTPREEVIFVSDPLMT